MTHDQRPPPARRNESAAELRARDAYLNMLIEPRGGWPQRTGADIGYIFEALGLTADDFEAVVRLAHEVTPSYTPAGLRFAGYHFAVWPRDQFYGEPLGVYLDVVIVARVATPR